MTQEVCSLLEWVLSLLGTDQCLILGEVTSAWSERWSFQEEENVAVFKKLVCQFLQLKLEEHLAFGLSWGQQRNQLAGLMLCALACTTLLTLPTSCAQSGLS